MRLDMQTIPCHDLHVQVLGVKLRIYDLDVRLDVQATLLRNSQMFLGRKCDEWLAAQPGYARVWICV